MTGPSNSYFDKLAYAIQLIDHLPIKKATAILREAKERDAHIYIFGNGGSAATAMHFANDLVKMAGMWAHSLTNLSILTAYANDEGYKEIFRGPLSVLMQNGDIAIGISCSGRSPNVFNALAYAKDKGNATIALVGDERVHIPIVDMRPDACIHIPAQDIRLQEDLHLAICHVIAGALQDE